ncbi:filamentous hemagglutinin N-terminal domain-containing protein, partial [Moorena sp. SIO2C4]
MKILHSLVIFGGISLSGYYGITHSADPALAQIVPDHTLGDNPTVVKPNVEVKGLPADLIEGGATRGDNLFHSFSDFNVGDLQRVYFANPAGINNILGRVTGSNISKIFGTLGVDGAANLFLLNPNGIVFGANSQLDVAGSFVGSTANSIVFGNGTEFSATNPEEPPLLTINITPGLQYGQNPPQPIVNAGNLAVGQGQNVTLVGGSVISNGQILAPGGEINILAVPAETLVQLGQAGQILTLSTPKVPLTPSAPASVTEFLSSLDHDTGVTVSSDGQVTLTDSGTVVPLEPGTVMISGTLSAANLAPGQTGGKVTVLGDQVGLFEAQLNGGTNVTITTGNTGTQEGNITADDFGITKTTDGEVTLSLQAANDISLKKFDIKANSGFLNLVLEADSDNSGSGDVELMDGSIDTGGGAVTITAAGAIALESFGINRNNNRSDQAPPITVISGESISLKSAGINSLTSGDNGNAGNVIVQTGTLTIEEAGIGSRTKGKG